MPDTSLPVLLSLASHELRGPAARRLRRADPHPRARPGRRLRERWVGGKWQGFVVKL